MRVSLRLNGCLCRFFHSIFWRSFHRGWLRGLGRLRGIHFRRLDPVIRHVRAVGCLRDHGGFVLGVFGDGTRRCVGVFGAVVFGHIFRNRGLGRFSRGQFFGGRHRRQIRRHNCIGDHCFAGRRGDTLCSRFIGFGGRHFGALQGDGLGGVLGSLWHVGFGNRRNPGFRRLVQNVCGCHLGHRLGLGRCLGRCSVLRFLYRRFMHGFHRGQTLARQAGVKILVQINGFHAADLTRLFLRCDGGCHRCIGGIGRFVVRGFGRPFARPGPRFFGFVFFFGSGARGFFFFCHQRLTVGDGDLVVIGVDFRKRQKAVAVAAVVDKGRLQRGFDPRDLG